MAYCPCLELQRSFATRMLISSLCRKSIKDARGAREPSKPKNLQDLPATTPSSVKRSISMGASMAKRS